MKKLVSFLSVAALCFGFVACDKDDTETPEVKTPVIQATASISVAATAHQDKIEYTIENPIEGETIEAVTTAEWIGSFDYATAGEVRFQVEANDGDARVANVTLSYAKAQSVSVEVRQLGNTNVLLKIVDEDLREFIKTTFDANGDGMVTEDEAAAVTEIVIADGVTSAEGIEFFPNLVKLDLRGSSFTSIDLSKNTKLQEINVNYCQALESINVAGCSEVTQFNVGLCPALTSVDITGMPKLVDFISYSSGLTAIDTSKNPELVSLAVYGCKYSSLDLSANTKLTSLNAGASTLTSIDLSKNTALTSLSLDNSSLLTSIDLSANTALTRATFEDCDLKTVDISMLSELTYFSASRNNHFESLDISNNLKLETCMLLCYPGDGEGTYYLYLTREQDSTVSLWTTFCCEKRYIEPDIADQIADAAFRQYCLDNFDTDKDGKLTQTELEAVTAINTALASAEGIELFTNLVSLKANSSTCSTIDLSKNTKLEIFYMSYNANLESVNLTGCTAMKEIIVSGCSKLTSIDTSNMPALEEVYAQSSGLTSFEAPASSKLWYLSIYDTKITSLDVSKNVGLTNLMAGQTALTTIDLSANAALEKLDLNETKVTSIDLAANTALKTLILKDCNFKTVDTDALANLEEFDIDANNNLQKIDISKNSNLKKLSARCYPGDGEGTYYLYLTREQDSNVSLWLTFCCEKVYVEAEAGDLLEQIANYRIQEYVIENYDANGDGKLSQAEAEAVTKIVAGSVTDATGIELFPNLTELELTNALFSSIDLSKNTRLTSLNLKYGAEITSLDLSANTALTTVNCERCNLKTLDIANLSALETLTLTANNNFERLDISKNLNLKTLNAACYPGGGDGSWTLRLLRSQDSTVSMTIGSCDKEYVD